MKKRDILLIIMLLCCVSFCACNNGREISDSEAKEDITEDSFPEVTDIRENKDGTVTLTVDAVCSMILCDDAVITHELTVKFAEDGSCRYLGNKILDDGLSNIPEYQYRIVRK